MDGETELGTRFVRTDADTDHAVLLTPGFSEWTHSLESLAREFASHGYDAHLKPLIGQEDREQRFYDLAQTPEAHTPM